MLAEIMETLAVDLRRNECNRVKVNGKAMIYGPIPFRPRRFEGYPYGLNGLWWWVTPSYSRAHWRETPAPWLLFPKATVEWVGADTCEGPGVLYGNHFFAISEPSLFRKMDWAEICQWLGISC